jgi:hypothetical protein
VTTLLQDSFTGSNGTNLTAHTMDVGPGWTAATGSLVLASNQAANGSGVSLYASDSTAADGTVSCDCYPGNNNAGAGTGVVFRFTDMSNYWLAFLTNNTFELAEVASGTLTNRASTSFGFTGDGAHKYTISVTYAGASISATVNGGNTISYGSAATGLSATKCGLYSNLGGGNHDFFDNFLVTGTPSYHVIKNLISLPPPSVAYFE